MPRFSIVIPVYNAEKYIGECVKSVLSQSITDFELILVDDGSTDKSGMLCDNLALQDNRVKVIHQPNSGHISARMNGVKQAVGEYVLFIDSDDYWLDGCLEKVDKNIDRFGCDILVFRLQRGEEICHDFFGGEKPYITHGEYFTVNLAETGMNCLVIKAFARKLFETVDISSFSHLRNSEDLVLSTMLAKAAESISYVPDVLYYYRPNETSITNTFNENAMEEFVFSRNVLWAELERLGLDNKQNKKVLYLGFLRRAADYAMQISLSKIPLTDKKHHLEKICNMNIFKEAIAEADLSVFGKAKQMRIKLLLARNFTALILLDKVRNFVI